MMEEILACKSFAVLGDTLNREKFACKIKNALIKNQKTVYAVGKELPSLNDIEEEIEVLDFCINPPAGLELLKEFKGTAKFAVLQPGAGSEKIRLLLKERNIPFIDDCIYKALKLKGLL